MLSDAEFRRYLDEVLITGEVLTGRESNYSNLRKLADRDEFQRYGVDVEDHWTFDSLLQLMVDRVGISGDPAFTAGQDTIDGALTVDKLTAYRARFERALDDGETILFATAHPATLMPVYQQFAALAETRGATVVDIHSLPQSQPTGTWLPFADRHHAVWQTGGVAALYRGGSLMHTHSPEPMNLLLDALEAHDGTPVPTFVVADHGWACAAGRRGYPTIAIADCNDPAVFVAEAQGSVEITVPMDDGLSVHLYEPVVDFVLRR